MKNEREHKKICRKLNTLKDMIKAVNSDVLMLRKISTQTGNILQNENISGNEINTFEDNLDCLIKEYAKPGNEILKTENTGRKPYDLVSIEDEYRVILSKEILN